MKFFVDEQLPVSMARWLRDQGHEATHIDELGLRASPDLAISELVGEGGGIVVSKDADFIELRRRDPRFQVLWFRIGNASTAALIERLSEAWPAVLAALEAGEPVVELH